MESRNAFDALKEFNKQPGNITDVSELLINDLQLNKITFVEVVEQLEDTLTNVNPGYRNFGVKLLADVLHGIPEDFLNSKEISFLTSFFVDRLKDQNSVLPSVIFAFLQLVSLKQIEKIDIQTIVKGLFNDIHCQSEVMTDRRNIYLIFKTCIFKRLEDLQEIGPDFIMGFASSADGEKDPRNLVILFSIFPVIAKKIPLGPFAEDLFEVVAAYFPICFVPPTNDPYGISSEDLVLGLRRCLSCSAEFAPFCLNLLQEKLDSDLLSAKIDSLLTLIECCTVYEATHISTYAMSLWSSIRRDVFGLYYSDIEDTAILALFSILKNLHKGVLSSHSIDIANQFLESILNECCSHFCNPEQRLAYISAKMLISLCDCSSSVAITVCQRIFPELLSQFIKQPDELFKKNILSMLSKFIEKIAHIEEVQDLLKNIWRIITESLDSNFILVKRESVLAIKTNAKCLCDDDAILCATKLISNLRENDNCDIELYSSCLQEIGFYKSDVVKGSYISFALENFKAGKYKNLEALAKILCCQGVASVVMSYLWEQITEEIKGNSANALVLLQAVTKITKHIGKSQNRIFLKEWGIVEKSFVLSCHVLLTIQDPVLLLQQLSLLLRFSISYTSLENEEIMRYIDILIELYNHKGKADLSKLSIDSAFSETVNINSILYPLEGIVVPLKYVEFYQDLPALIKILEELVFLSNEENASIAAASVINKINSGTQLQQIVTQSYSKFSQALNYDLDYHRRERALIFWIWITKALVIRGSDLATIWVEKLMSMLLEGLKSDYAAIFEVVVSTLFAILEFSANPAENHVPFLIEHLIPLCSAPEMMIRISALKCLYCLSKLPALLILPHRENVCIALYS